MNVADYFYQLLKPLFPANANLNLVDLKTSDLVFLVNWRAPSDQRPNKRTHSIHVAISEDVIDDYHTNPRDQKQMDVFITAYVKARLNSFVDDGLATPPIQWNVTPDTYAAEQF